MVDDSLLSELRISTANQATSYVAGNVSAESIGATLRRRLALVSGCVLAALLAGAIYLAATPTRYVAVAKVLVERLTGNTAPGQPDAVIDAQPDVVRSSEVLRLAESKELLGDLATFRGINDPVPTMRKSIGVSVGRSGAGSVLTITYPAASDSDAVAIVDAVVDAYKGYQTEQREQKSQELSIAIAADRKKLGADLDEARRALADYDRATGGAGLETPAARMSAVSNALTEATLATLSAKRKYDDAVAVAGPALSGLNDEELERSLKDASAYAPDSPEIIEQEMRMLENQLAELRKTYADNHPSVIRAAARIKQVRIAQAATMRSRWLSAKERESDLQKAFDQLQRDASVQTAKQAERAQLAANVGRLQARVDDLDGKLNELALSTAGSLNISVLTPAEANNPSYPTLPRKLPTLMISGLIGLALGGLVSIVAELRSARRSAGMLPMRGSMPLVDAAGKTLGIKKLGEIPETDAASEGHPLELLSHEDPFGPFANAVRSLRSACEVEGALPASMILTSASSGEGKTTLALNLAATIAREGRKVLLIDLNFAKPTLHRLLGVEENKGLSDLLAGGDAVELIRSTSLARVDLLAAGGNPQDSGRLLNSEALPQSLSMLTSAYDHVIFDGNALSIGDDARIVASLTDATILVSKDTPPSLRRAAGARDMLLMVGANLLGVALTRTRPITTSGSTLQD